MNTARRAVLLALVTALAACSTTAAPVAVAPTTAAPTATATPTPAPTIAPDATPVPLPKWDEVPVPAQDPVALGAQLGMAEGFIRDPKVTADQLAWAGHMEELVLGQLSDYPDWVSQVVGALPENERAAFNGSIEAGRQLRTMHGPIPKTLPDWHIVAPAPIDDLLAYYKEAEAKFGVPWYYLASINLIETRMGRIRGDPTAGAHDPKQSIPQNQAAYGQRYVNSRQNCHL